MEVSTICIRDGIAGFLRIYGNGVQFLSALCARFESIASELEMAHSYQNNSSQNKLRKEGKELYNTGDKVAIASSGEDDGYEMMGSLHLQGGDVPVQTHTYNIEKTLYHLDGLFGEAKALIKGLSTTVIFCIMKGYVGNLREMNAEPMPSPDMMTVIEDATRIVESLKAKERHSAEEGVGKVKKFPIALNP